LDKLRRWYLEVNVPQDIIIKYELQNIKGNPFNKRFYCLIIEEINRMVNYLKMQEEEIKKRGLEPKIVEIEAGDENGKEDGGNSQEDKEKKEEYLYYLSTAPLIKEPEKVNKILINIAEKLDIRFNKGLLEGKRNSKEFKEKSTKEQIRIIKEIFKEVDDYKVDCVKSNISMRAGNEWINYSILGVRPSEMRKKLMPHFICQGDVDRVMNWYNDYQLKMLEPDDLEQDE